MARILTWKSLEIEPFVKTSFTCTIAPVTVFQCSVCGTEITVNSQGVAKSEKVECLNPECGCHFFVVKDDEQLLFRLDAYSVECPECKEKIQVPNRKLQIGYEFKCPRCGIPFEVFGPIWQFKKKDLKADQNK